MSVKFRIQIRPDPKSQKILRLVDQWPTRTEHLMAQVAYLAATHVREDLLQRLPKTEEWASYRDSLEVVKINGGPKEAEAIYAVRSNPKARGIREVDAPKTVVYIRTNRKRLKRPKAEILVLEKYSPWTLQTLPFMPERIDAVIVTRRVTRREAQEVNKARMRDRSKWRKELTRAGVRQVKLDKTLKISSRTKAVPDVAFQALRLEFGLGGKPRAHWRPSIRHLMRSGLKSMFRQDRSLKMTLTRPGFREWTKWPHRIRSKARFGEVRNYLPFQKKLGIRISGS